MNEKIRIPEWCKIGNTVHIKSTDFLYPGRFGVIFGIGKNGWIDVKITGIDKKEMTIHIDNLEKELFEEEGNKRNLEFCPHCGSKDVKYRERDPGGCMIWEKCVSCNVCGCSSPYLFDGEEAIRRWNARVSENKEV